LTFFNTYHKIITIGSQQNWYMNPGISLSALCMSEY